MSFRIGYACPKCRHRLAWFQRVKLAPWGVRRVVPCPVCLEPLEWDEWPHRFVVTGTLVTVILAVGFLLSNDDPAWRNTFCIALVLTSIAVSFRKPQRHHDNNSN